MLTAATANRHNYSVDFHCIETQNGDTVTSLISNLRDSFKYAIDLISYLKKPVFLILAIPVAMVLAIPFLYGILFFFKFLNIRLKRNLSGEIKPTVENYKYLKLKQSQLVNDLKTIKETVEFLSTTSLILKLAFVGEINKTHNTLSDYNTRLNKSLDDLDAVETQGEYLNTIPEKVLWENRTECYEYLL